MEVEQKLYLFNVIDIKNNFSDTRSCGASCNLLGFRCYVQ